MNDESKPIADDLAQAIGDAVVEELAEPGAALSALAGLDLSPNRDEADETLLERRRQDLAQATGPRRSSFAYCVCLGLLGMGLAQGYLSLILNSGLLLLCGLVTLLVGWMAWRKAQWMQFNLRSALVTMVVLSLPFAWLGAVIRRHSHEQAAVKLLEDEWAAECQLSYAHLPQWFRDYCPATWLTVFGQVDSVAIHRTSFGDAELPLLDPLIALETLDVRDTQLTDAGVEHLTRHQSLTVLYLGGTKITREALVPLRRLPELLRLEAIGTGINKEDARVFRVRHPKVQVATGTRKVRRPALQNWTPGGTVGARPPAESAFDDLQPEIEAALQERINAAILAPMPTGAAPSPAEPLPE